MPKPKNSTRIKGKCSPYGFFVKMCYDEHKKQFPDEFISVCAVTKMCASKWAKMDESMKNSFYILAKRDADRYDSEFSAHCKAIGVPIRAPKKSKKKDPNAPKKPLTAFIFFSNAKRPEIRAQLPEARITQLSKWLGDCWRNMSADEKAPYIQKAEAAKVEYNCAMELYRTKKPVEEEMEVYYEPEPEQLTIFYPCYVYPEVVHNFQASYFLDTGDHHFENNF